MDHIVNNLKKADLLGIRKQLIFTEMISPKKITNYYAVGDIFVSASNSETQGLTYMEAMVSGLPLLCKADDCLKNVIISCSNGFLYYTEKEFLNYYKQLKNDFLYRNQVGIMARRSIQDRYSIQAFANSCIDVYRSVICKYEK